ncbi:MAG TPA: hypothetical protein PLW65_26680 [Pseudomonadota bacterium]|nr:hypothetical protein [Pseudomonadota bacterium]
MKIALILDRFDPQRGGLEHWAWQWTEWLLARGCGVEVVAAEVRRDLARQRLSLHALGFADSRCVVEVGLVEPDLVLAASSALLPRLQALPTVLGLPLLASPAGIELGLSLLSEPVLLRRPATLLHSPRRAARAALDVWRLVRLLAGG